MAADSVGQIGLDLVVNDGSFKKQMSGIQGLAKKAGAALAAAFAVKKIVDFGTQCVELGSQLSEVQNVVDVTFPQMSAQVNKFAKDAKEQFGIGEIAAKRFTGTFGAMAKAFGFNEKVAFEMSTALTGLAGDVASFYDMNVDEAYTKLKSVFTGETETLKDLGIVMTQNALDSYALANGYGKVTAKMTEAEKVALRYKFVQDQLSLASGDFVRTSDSWANQVRVLTENFNDLKSAIGQGLINVLTPVIKVINLIIGKLMSLANAFRSFTEMITGKKSGGGVSAAVTGMEDVAGSADNASAAMGGAGSAAKKAAKDIKGATSGIDELNIIQAPDSSGSGGDAGAGGGYAADEFDMGDVDTSAIDEMDSKYQGLIDKARELASLFKGGFNIAFGDTKVLDNIRESISSIGQSLKGIFTDPEVVSAADNFLNNLVFNLGKVAGGMASIGASIADNLLGGISLFLEQNSQRIKEYLVSMFDIGSDISNITGRFSEAAATIFEAFRSDSAKQITADIIGIFSSAFMGVTELIGTFAADVLDLITAPFIQNKDLIKQTLEDTFSAVEPIFSEIKAIVDECFDGLKKTYDDSVAPMINSFKEGFTEIATKLLEAYNQYILPVIEEMAQRFQEFHEQYLSPLIDKFLEFAGKVADAITAVWENFLKPFVLWFIEAMAPVIGNALSGLVDMFFDWWEGISETLGYVFDALGGLMDFITGIFTGDWNKAWNGIKTFFSQIWEAMKGLTNTLMTAISNIISTLLGVIKGVWEVIWGKIKEFISSIWDSIKEKVSSVIEDIRKGIEDKITTIKTKWDEIWGGVKKTTEDIFQGMWDFIKGIINNILSGIEKMANGVVKGINRMIEALNSLSIDVPDTPFGDGFTLGFDIPTLDEISLPRLAQGGFVKANTPQLAMIGDNRHYGEIVAPEDKMQAMVDKAVAMASRPDSMSEQYLMIMIDLLKKIIELIENFDLIVNIDIREIRQKLKDLEKRSGFAFG